MSRALAAAVALLGACTQPAPTPAPPRPPAPTTPTTVATTTTAAVRAPEPQPARVPPAGPVASPAGVAAAQTARASWYARGARTANGEAFDPDGLTYASRTDPFGTLTRFCHDGRCVVARCTDRGPAAWTHRQFDLSRGAFASIAALGNGVITVQWSAA